MTNLIMPHGSNELNTLYIEDELARASMLSAAAEMRTLEISSAAAADDISSVLISAAADSIDARANSSSI